jgi:hypothetical protein
MLGLELGCPGSLESRGVVAGLVPRRQALGSRSVPRVEAAVSYHLDV